jgi:3',5'-cyclic AMP phosphodiesterase CpdA
MRLRLFALLTAGALWAAPAETWVGGPYVVNVGPRSATVVWVVPATEVKLGTEPGKLTQAAASLRAEKVTYSGLKPGTTYYYDVGGRDEGKGQFKTAPVGDASFKFVVYGDTRTRHDMHRRVIEAVQKAEPDFIVHTGDLVADGSDTTHWPFFFSIERELLRKAAFFPSLGNHERNNPQFYDFFQVRTPYYSFDWGQAHFTILNSDLGNAALSRSAREQFWTEQTRWLEQDLERSQKAAFRFVAMHHPPFTAVKRRQGGNREVQALVPIFEKYRATVVFGGHDHNYQHHFKDGVRYVVTGGGGAPLYEVDGAMEGLTQKVESTEHFVQVKVDGSKARLEAVALDGRLIDQIEVENR